MRRFDQVNVFELLHPSWTVMFRLAPRSYHYCLASPVLNDNAWESPSGHERHVSHWRNSAPYAAMAFQNGLRLDEVSRVLLSLTKSQVF